MISAMWMEILQQWVQSYSNMSIRHSNDDSLRLNKRSSSGYSILYGGRLSNINKLQTITERGRKTLRAG